MGRKKDFYLVLDTETTGLDDKYVYDIGGVVCDRNGNIYETFSFMVKELWDNHFELLRTAYYSQKLPQYIEKYCNKGIEKEKYFYIKMYIKTLCEKYNVRAILAYNAYFDWSATRETQMFLTNGKYKTFLPYGIEVWDILKMTRDVIGTKKKYQKFCQENDYMTNHLTPQPQLKAEVVYRFITGDNGFIESHTGLEDALIEAKIFAYCNKQKKKMRRKLFEN